MADYIISGWSIADLNEQHFIDRDIQYVCFHYELDGVQYRDDLGKTMSLDDFVISHFVSSPNFQTLPLYVYNQTVHNVKFSMYALCALIVAVILAILLIVNFSGSIGGKRRSKKGVSQ